MNFEEFLPHVLPSVAGCSDEVAIQHIVRAARKFCGRTNVWSRETDPVLTSPGQSLYTLDLDDGQERSKLLRAWVDGREVSAIDASLGRQKARRQQTGEFVYLENGLDFVVYPTPVADGLEVVMELAVKPTVDATEWPDELADHITDIAHGAISSLCMLPREDWTDAKVGADQLVLFNQRIAIVAYNVSRGFSKTRKRARVTFF